MPPSHKPVLTERKGYMVGINVYEHPNVHKRKFCIIGEEICSVMEERFVFPLIKADFQSEDWRSIGYLARKLVKRLSEVKGIDEISIGRHHLIVVKNPSSKWSFIEPDVVHEFEILFGRVRLNGETA